MKKTQMQNLLKGFGFFLLSILLATCEVGLGPSVDTSAPNLTVSSPTASAILKGTISLGGSVSDDTTVTSVKVKFKGISSSNNNEYQYDATIDTANETWSLTINTLDGEGVKDGNYELTVTATDNSGKESFRTTTFYVDNTAPVLMVDTPDVKNATMNYDVELEGKLYDQSEVTKLTVVICDTNGNEKIRKDANVTNNSTWKVTFDGDTELGLAAGNQLLADNGSYYYYVVATDAVNNTSEYFFHKPDVYTQFTGRKLDISEWASFDKGDTNTVSGQTLSRDWFNSIKIRVASMSSPSSVSIAPYFSYSSQDVAGIEWKNIETGSSIAKDASIVGVITPPAGVDSPFKNETFKCYIFPGLGTNGTDPFVIGANGLVKIKRENSSGEIYEEEPSSDNQWPTVNPVTGRSMITLANTGTGRNFTISTGLPDSNPLCLKAERCWIYIEIENSIGTKFSAHTSFDINPGTPVLTITASEISENLQTTINTNSYVITGTSFTSGGHGCDVTYKIFSAGATVTEGEANYSADFDTSGEWSLPIGDLNLADGTYSFTFTAAISGLKAVESRTITIDRTDPDLNIVTISQDTNGNKVTVSGSANDTNGLYSVKYRLTPLQSAWQTPVVQYNWVYEIDTTAATEAEHTFEIQVVDMAGNTSSDSTTIVIDHDPPELSVTNGNWSSRDVQAMTGTATDTHFDSLSVTYRNSSVSSSTAVTETVTVNPTTHAWSWTPASTIADGIYDVTFEARDTANKTRTYTTSFTRDQNGPVIEEVSLANNDVTEKGETNSSPLDITVRASDTPAGLKSIEYKVNGGTYTAIPNVSTRSTINLSGLPEGENTIEIKAIDNSDNETIYTYTPEGGTPQSVIHFTTDYNEPEVWFGDTVAVTTDLTVNDDVWIKGKLTDGVNTSKMKDAKLSYTKNGITTTIWSLEDGSTSNGFTWNSDSDYKWQWKLEKGSDGANDGRYTFKFNYKDIADNSNTIERTVIMDTTGPVVNGILRESGQTYQSIENEIGVSFADSLSGIDEDKLYWKLGPDTGNETGATQFTGETITVDFGSEGVGKELTFIAYDLSGNRTYKTYSNITVDLGAPTLYDNVFNTPDTYIKNGDPAFNLLKSSGTVAEDGVAIKKLEVTAKKDGVAQNGTGRTDGKWYVYEVADNVTKTSLTVSDLAIPAFSAIPPTGEDGAPSYGANDGSWAISVAVYDRNLQKSEEKTLNFIIDASLPIMQPITSPAAGYITGSAVDIRGSVSDPEKGTGINTVTLVFTGTKDGAPDTETATTSGSEWSSRLALGDWDEGTISVSATATDRAGNESAPRTASWTIDKNIPVIEETTLGTGESVWRKGNFTVGGTVEDTYSVSPDDFVLSVTRKATGGSTYEAVASDRISLTKTPVGTNGKKYNWTATITVPANESAEYKITADATDSSGKHATLITRTVDIDMVAPTTEFTNLNVVSGVTGATVIDGSAYTIKGKATDGASGIKEVKYSIDGATAVSTGITLNGDRWELPIELGTDGIAEGQHTIEVTAEDNAGNTATAITTTFVVDLAAPTLTIADITESSTCRIVGTNTYISAPLTLVGTVLDANPLSVDSSFANKMTVTAYVNGTAVTGTGAASYTPGTTTTAGTWSFAVPTDTDGLKTIKIVARDAVGNETQVIQNITVDTQAPTVTVTKPGTEEKPGIVEGTFTLTATAYDSGQGVQWVKYSFANTDSATWTAMTGSGSTYTAEITAAALGDEGEKHIYVKAFDGLKESTANENFYYDTADPTLTVTRSTTDAYTNQSYTITIEDAYDENLSGVKIIAKKDNTTLTGAGEETGIWKSFAATNKRVTNQSVTITEDGSYTFTVSAVDGAGNPTSVSFSIVVDATAPVVGTPSANASSLSNGNFVSGSAIDISGTLTESENGSGLESVTITLEGTKNGTASTETQNPRYTSNEWTYRLPLGDWDEGELSVTATATDKAGNSATSTAMTFVIDQNDPEVTETTIGSGSSWRHENFTVGGTVTDTLGLSTENFTITVTKAVNGTSTTVDGITVNKAPVEGKGTATNCTEYTWSTTIAITANESAVYTIVANATDLSGRSPVQGVRRTVSIDTVAPVLSFTNLSTDSSNRTIMEGNSYTIEGTATDDLAGITSVSYKIDSGTPTTEGVTLSGDNTTRTWKVPVQLGGTDGLSEGAHTITISAQDVAGNAATSISTAFVVDLANPTVEFNNAVSLPAYINENLPLSGTVSDTNTESADVLQVKAYVNNVEYTGANAATYTKTGANGGTWSFTLFADTDGAKVVKIVATDMAGKKTEVSHTITVDKTPPVVSVVNPVSVSDDFTFTASAYDTGKGVTGLQYSLDNSTWNDMTESDSSWTVYLEKGEGKPLGTTEGAKTVYVKATDGLNWSTPVSTTFYLDTANPEITSVTTTPDSSFTNGNYTLTVSATDENLRDVVITAKKGTTDLTTGWPVTFTASDGAVTNQTATLTVPSDPEDHSADGTYTFNITATDNAGKTAFASKTVTVDTTVPTVADTFAVPDTTATEGSSYRFSGTASDGNGIEKVEISFTADGAADSVITANKTDAAGQNSWSYTLVFTDNNYNSIFSTEGDKEVHVRAIDVAGNVSPWVTKDFVYDKSAPTSTISQYKNNGGSDTDITANSFETGKVFELKGSASDTYGIANVKVYQQIGDGTPVLIDTLTTTSWTLENLPRNPESLSAAYTEGGKPVSGTYKYYAKATDSSGKTTDSATVTVTIDTTAPTVSITAPDSSVTPSNNKTGENSLSDESYTFRGTANDSHTGAVGVAKLMYAFVKADDAFNATEPTEYEWDDQPATDGNWSISRTLVAGTPATGELNEAHWYFFAKSVDAAGNESAVSKIHFHVDKSSPALVMTTNNVKDNENATYYFKDDDSFNATDGTITLAGTTSDTYGIKSVSITTKTGSANAVTTDLSTSGSWTHTFAVPADTTVAVTITATDNSDKTVTKKYTLYRDTAAPVVTIIAPAENESLLVTTKTLQGTASDAGSGIQTISYSIAKSGSSAEPITGNITLNGESWSVEDVNLGSGEGTFTITVTATDTLGNTTGNSVQNVFFVDTANPTLSETGVGTGGATTNETFTLSGWVHETNGLNSDAAVTISADKEGFTNIVLAASNLIKVADGTSTTELAADATFEGWYYWTKTFYVNGAVAGQNGVPDGATILADGTYVFTVTAKDVASKTDIIQRTVKVDTTAPTFSATTEGGSTFIQYTGASVNGTDGHAWRSSSNVTLTVYASDESTGSGLSTVEYAVYDSEGNAISGKTGAFNKISTNTTTGVSTMSTTIPLGDGESKVRITAKDVAGNTTVLPATGFESIYVDTTAPVVSVNSSEGVQDVITKVRDLSFYLHISETSSGIASVIATLGSGATARNITLTSGTYGVIAPTNDNATITVNGNAEQATHKITMNAAALDDLSGSKMLTVKATDTVGNESVSVNVANITIDTENPTIENLEFNPASGNQSYVYATTDASADYAYFVKGGTFRITGRTRDNIGIENTKVQVGSGEAQDVTPDGNGWYKDITPTGSTTVTVIATDKAENSSTKTIKLIFDTTAPVPEHIIDSNVKDLVFRVGNYDNDTRTDGPTWSSALDEDVGGKYSQQTYGNTLSITVRGHYIDEGSGLRRIYYKFYSTEAEINNKAANGTLLDDVVAAQQTIVPLTEPTTKRVFYKVKDGDPNPVSAENRVLYKAASNGKPAEYYTEITTNFVKEALGPLGAGENYFVLVAEDNVGNKAVDSATVSDGNGSTTTYYNYVLNVDTIAPSIPTVQSITYNGATITLNDGENLMVNQSLMGDTATINITLTATDTGGSGVKSVELTRVGINVLDNEDRIDSSDDDNTYTVKIPKAKVMSGAVSVRITDKAGNAADFGLFSITNDSTAPTVTLSSHNSDTTVNKTITLKGTAEDTNGVDSVVGVYYTRSALSKPENNTTPTGSNAASEWVPYTSSNKSGTNSWSIEVDTEASGFTDGVDHYFTVAVKDKAGNTGYSDPVKLKIDQSTDCPVISLRNLSTDGTGSLKNTVEIYGAVSDDDGNISTIDVSQDSGATWNSVTVQNGSWTYEVQGDDGAKQLYFKVTDPEGAVFATNRVGNSASSPVGNVYLTDQTNTITGPLTFSVDTNPPEIAASSVTIKGNSYTEAVPFSNNMTMGGSNTVFEFEVPAEDANGIDSVYIKIGDSTPIQGTLLTQTTGAPTGNGTWKISNVDISNTTTYEEGSVTVTITAKDTSAVTSNISRQVLIDRIAPSVTIQSHSAGEVVTGLQTLKGITEDEGSGVDNVKWMIPEANSAASINKDSDGWHPVTSGTTAWNIAFTTDAAKLANYANTTHGTQIMEGGVGTNVWSVPVYLRIEDKAGNVNVYKDFYYNVDPDGDKPRVAVTYPTKDADGNDPILGGSIRIFGTADDNVSVSEVWMQVDVNGDGNFNDTDKAALTGVVSKPADPNKNNNQAWWGIKATGTASWNIVINTNGEFNPNNTYHHANNTNQRTINVRFRSVDNNDLCGSWSTSLSIIVDATAPRIGSSEPLKLVQYSNNTAGTGNPVAVQDYQADMWIKGKWWLTGSVEDESGIKSIELQTINTDDVTIATSAIIKGVAKEFETNNETNYGYSFKIPIDTESFIDTNTRVSFKIHTIDSSDQELSTTQSIYLNYDNTSPEIGTLKNGNKTISTTTTDATDDNPGTTTIVQSNHGFSIEGTATEGGSGFYRMAVYFKRTDANGSNPRLYNPTLAKTNSFNKTDISDVSMTDGLPQLSFSDVGRTSETKLTLSTVNDNIRVGGLVKIGGVYRLITDVTQSNGSTTVEFSPGVGTNYTDASFVLALIIDNFTQETPTTWDNNDNPTYISNDDHDGVVETLERSGGAYNWSVSINSKNIPDGPIDICCVAFDKAENIKIAAPVSTKVENNKPAIAKVWIGTDYNGDGDINYYAPNDSRNEKVFKTIAETREQGWQKNTNAYAVSVPFTEANGYKFQAVAKTVIEPEIVGGNGALYYYYTTDTGSSVTGPVNLRTADAAEDGTAVTPITLNITGTESSPSARLEGLGDGEHIFHFTIWDSTDSLTGNALDMNNNTSQSATLDVTFNVNVVDEVDPAALIKPFFWNGKGTGNNSVYGTTSTEDKKDNSSYGHIELEKDWKNSNGYVSTATTGEYDGDPKVSGIIRIQGMAYDDTRLKEIAVSVDGFSLAGGTAGASVKLAKLDGGWKYYNGSTWSASPADKLSSEGWSFSVTKDKGITSDGHEVEWELILNTSYYSDVAGTDVAVNVVVYDGFGRASKTKNDITSMVITSFDGDPVVNASTDTTSSETVEWDNSSGISTITAVTGDGTNTTTVTTTATPYYRMDIVPYITGISTELSSGKRPTVLSRSALGNYPVRRGSKITVQGFNLNGTNSRVQIGNQEYTPGTETTLNSLVITTDANTPSEGVVAKVGTVLSLNNETIKTVEYNQEPNGQNNDLLTDKRELKVVDVTTTTNTTDKRMLDMAISGTNLYFSAGYESNHFSTMSVNGVTVTTTNLRESYTRYFDNAIAINSSGRLFTVSACGDSYNPVTGWGNGPSHLALTRGGKGNYIREYNGTNTNNNNNILFLESNWNGADLNNLDRFKLPDLVVTGTNDSSKGYLSYYDTTQKIIKFRYFTESANKIASNYTTYTNGSVTSGGSTQTTGVQTSVEGAVTTITGVNYSQGYIAIAGADENSQYSAVGVVGSTAIVSWYDAANGALKMKYNTSPDTSYSGYQEFNTVPNLGTVTLDIKVDGGTSKPVSVTWSNVANGARNNHEFAYQLNLILVNGYGAYAEVDPKSNKVTVRSMQTGTGSSIAITNLSSGSVNNAVVGAGSSWVERTIDDETAGQFVAMKTDSKGGIHFAYYDTGNGDLKYAYMSSVTATPVVVTVDGYQQVGQYVDLVVKEVVDEDNANITYITPYISYYSMSNADTKRAAKVASLANPIVYTGNSANAASVQNGSDDELFTGNWEAYHVPTNGIPVQYRVNIGVTSDKHVYISYLADRIIEYVKVE
ncbi:MAG: Ig-like domain repeat protein [Spirochaetaceae bacterium]|nr:Ig-like domain repeat protein [Spirochaetaceae bacterium]